jgi:predicted nucleic-acid-binding protein
VKSTACSQAGKSELLLGADTNIIVRLIVEDDDAQVHRILAVLDVHELFVPLTVLLETEWVLRSRYGWNRQEIANAFEALCKLTGIQVESSDNLGWAIEKYRTAGDFGDFVHIVSCTDCDGFATFDLALLKLAQNESPVAIKAVP